MGSPHPLLVLRRELNNLLSDEKSFLPAAMNSDEKDLACYFYPPDYADRTSRKSSHIAARLSDKPNRVLRADSLDEADVARCLSTEWVFS